ncbi:hypothetical protein ACFLQ0_00220, partial [Nitrospinota bacterium]
WWEKISRPLELGPMLRHDSTQRSFFDETLYDRLIAPDHFLNRLNSVIDLGFVHRLCRGCYARASCPKTQLNPKSLFKRSCGAIMLHYTPLERENPPA